MKLTHKKTSVPMIIRRARKESRSHSTKSGIILMTKISANGNSSTTQNYKETFAIFWRIFSRNKTMPYLTKKPFKTYKNGMRTHTNITKVPQGRSKDCGRRWYNTVDKPRSTHRKGQLFNVISTQQPSLTHMKKTDLIIF